MSIQITYACIHPENTSKYTCSTAGHPTANGLNNSYISPISTVPDITLPNRRSESDNGTANSPIRFIGNTKGGWQPYASVGMVWNLLNETNATADGVKLPEMHTKPYVEYGVGLQRTWADKFSAYGQALHGHVREPHR